MAQTTGKIIKHLPSSSGQGKNGTWERGGIAITETEAKYPKTIAISLWGDLVDVGKSLAVGTIVRVSFDVESREYQDKWYTDVKGYKIEVNKNGNWEPASGQYVPPATTENTEFNPNQQDDLPF